MPERLALVDIADVHFQNRPLKGIERIQDRHRCMAIGPWVDDDPRRILARLLDPVHQLPLMVRLVAGHRHAQFGRQTRQRRLDIGQRLAPVNLGLALTQKVQVRAIQNKDRLGHGGVSFANMPKA